MILKYIKTHFTLTIFILIAINVCAFASTDSLYIKGQIQNLNGRLYRQAPTITFSRNNIFQPQTVQSKQVNLNADGSFSTSLPLYFAQEEIYMDYGGQISATFLGSQGEVNITFDGAALPNTEKKVSFTGINAQANNLYPKFLIAENQIFEANPALGKNFYQKFWQLTPTEANTAVLKRSELRKQALVIAQKGQSSDNTFIQWIGSIIEKERLQNLYEYTLYNNYTIQPEMIKSLSGLTDSPLTSQHVSWANRVGAYADRQNEEFRFKNPSKTQSLPIRQTALLLKYNATNISSQETDILNEIISRGTASSAQLDLLNTVFAKNDLALTPIFNFEREVKIYDTLFGDEVSSFLKTRHFIRNFYNYDLKQIKQLDAHFQKFLTIPTYSKSLDELVTLEVKDSVDTKKFVNTNPNESLPAEIVPGFKLSTSNEKGNTWLNQVLETYKGKAVYLIKWDLEDEKAREQLTHIPFLRAQLPENVEFVFVHYSFGENNPNSRDLAKKFAIRNHLEGTHMFLKPNQGLDLLFKLNPMDSGTYMIFRPNGKPYAKNAPSPDQTKVAIQAITEAINR